jgi:hypothetical protein
MYICEICNKQFEKRLQLQGHKAHHVERNGLDIILLRERKKIIKENNISKYMENPEHCKQCGNIIDYEKYLVKNNDRRKEIKKGRLNYNYFCTHSCAATYNNTHKEKGNRKSKLEFYLEEQLPLLFPNLEFHFNRKDAINSELDIYIPTIRLAFELNGIFHYEPIYGENKLNQIKNNDNRKFQACLEQNIELCIIDTSKLIYFKKENADPFLEIVKEIINKKINFVKELTPTI